MDSNHRPRAYQARALATWATDRYFSVAIGSRSSWWRWRESNPWPPACRAGALPAELHPRVKGFERSEMILKNWTASSEFACKLNFSSNGFAYFRIWKTSVELFPILHRKEVIQPHLPIRLPCYDLTPITEPTFDCCLLAVSSQASGVPNFHGLTGGVYKARERIHRDMLIRDY